MSMMVDLPPFASGITTLPLAKTKYGRQIAIVLPWISDFDAGFDFAIEAKMLHNRRISFWYRPSPNYEDQYEIWSNELTIDNIHLGIHTVEIKIIDKVTKIEGGTIKIKIEVLSITEWIRQGLADDDENSDTGGPEFTGTAFFGCISSDPYYDTGLETYADVLTDEVQRFDDLIEEQAAA